MEFCGCVYSLQVWDWSCCMPCISHLFDGMTRGIAEFIVHKLIDAYWWLPGGTKSNVDANRVGGVGRRSGCFVLYFSDTQHGHERKSARRLELLYGASVKNRQRCTGWIYCVETKQKRCG